MHRHLSDTPDNLFTRTIITGQTIHTISINLPSLVDWLEHGFIEAAVHGVIKRLNQCHTIIQVGDSDDQRRLRL